ncbi:MAG: hypothetical protein EHM55_10630 [Acidobacteria bacterium]|nr:MAG: hypothetical protein EHM55_10630 [Acidobacteriota bacterium]
MRGKLPARVALVAVLCTALATSSAYTIPNIPSAAYQVVEEAVTVAATTANQFFERIHSYGF